MRYFIVILLFSFSCFYPCALQANKSNAEAERDKPNLTRVMTALSSVGARSSHILHFWSNEHANNLNATAAGNIASYVYLGTLATSSLPYLQSQVGLGIVIASAILFSAIRLSGVVDIWGASVADELSATTRIPNFEGPTRSVLFGSVDAALPRVLGVIFHW